MRERFARWHGLLVEMLRAGIPSHEAEGFVPETIYVTTKEGTTMKYKNVLEGLRKKISSNTTMKKRIESPSRKQSGRELIWNPQIKAFYFYRWLRIEIKEGI